MMNCIQCKGIAKYKCPTCRKPYCSVDCCKLHKAIPCSPPAPPLEESAAHEPDKNYLYPTEDTVPPEKLKLLENSKEVMKCLENPHVREILQLLDKSPNPDKLMKEYMTEPIFTEFVDACLEVVQDKK